MTPRGVQVARAKCRLIDKVYHEVGVDCAKIGARYHKIDNKICFNVETQEYEIRTQKHVYGVVIQKNRKVSWGAFILGKDAIKIATDNLFMAPNPEQALELNGTKQFYYCNSELRFNLMFPNYGIEQGKEIYKDFGNRLVKIKTDGLPYQALDSAAFSVYVKKNREFMGKLMDDTINGYGALLKYSIGCEYETTAGVLTDSLCEKLGVIKLRDGSLQDKETGLCGLEYSTVPMENSIALLSNIIIPTVLSKRHSYDMTCSFHTHLGGYPLDKKKIVSLYLLMTRLQGEIDEIIPPYRKTPDFIEKVFMKEGKNYCAPIPSLRISASRLGSKEDSEDTIADAFDKIFSFYGDGATPLKDWSRTPQNHPNNHKWNQKARYSILNLVPLFFGKSRTVEFRQMTATLSPVKIISWIYLCNAILEFAERNTESVLSREKIDIDDVLRIYNEKGPYGKEMYQFLSSFFTARKGLFENYYLKHHKYYSFLEESRNDSIFVENFLPNDLQAIFKSYSEGSY